jgi:DNA polymerase III subunit delta'
MSWTGILGHAEQIESLRTSAARGRLAHTYAFIGPKGIGKHRFALALAGCLLCEKHTDSELIGCGSCTSCRQAAAGTHPDISLVGLLEDKRQLLIAQFIGEREERGQVGLCHDLSLAPMYGRRKVAIIDDADCLNDESANALLKTLEEPPRNSLIILIARESDLLLPTIRSRCQMLAFRPLAAEHVAQLLLREGLCSSEKEALSVACLSQGSLDTARQLVDPQLQTLRSTLYDLLSQDPFPTAELSVRMIKLLPQATTESKVGQRDAAGWITRFSIEFYRRLLRRLASESPNGNNGNEADSTAEIPAEIPEVARCAQRFSSRGYEPADRITHLLERCFRASDQLNSNATIPLCLEALFEDLGRSQS